MVKRCDARKVKNEQEKKDIYMWHPTVHIKEVRQRLYLSLTFFFIYLCHPTLGIYSPEGT